ncbi:tetratricopeptide repeat protein [Marinibacterium anthonyi]|nr:tetratricopeptide repeat protein [Marinibacterium anthonyi]
MLWSLIKVLVFVAIVAALALGASYLIETEGGVQVTVAGIEYTFGPLESVLALILLLVGLWIVLKVASFLVALLKFLAGDETALSRYFDRSRERRGYRALSESLMALASGEGKVAMSQAQKAEKLLGKPEITNIITAQAAEMAGDTKLAAEAYKKLLTDKTTRFVGVRGILKQKLAEGDKDTAKKLAEKAFELKPRHEEVQDILLRLQADTHDWKGARNTLNAKLKSGSLPRDVYTRREAVLALSEAQDIIDADASIEARETAIAANKKSPDLIPASVMAARAYIKGGNPKYATRILKKTWSVMPHPDLAAAFAEIAPEETAAQRVDRFKVLTDLNVDHPETRMLKAELLIAAEDFPAARRALGDLVETKPNVRVLTMMAAIERGEGAPEAVVRGWLGKAVTAPRGMRWVCDNCSQVHKDWMPVCSNCGGFDTLSWREAPDDAVGGAQGEHMIPLIVGDDPAEPVPAPVMEPEDVTPPVQPRSEPEIVEDVPPRPDVEPINGDTMDGEGFRK